MCDTIEWWRERDWIDVCSEGMFTFMGYTIGVGLYVELLGRVLHHV